MGADFINIELEVRDSSDLSKLAAAFGKKFSVNYCGQLSRGKYLLSGALAENGRWSSSPDAIAAGLCRMIKGLKSPAKKIWSKASDRVFDVGFDATIDRSPIVNLFSHSVVTDIGKLGARIAVSVYTHDLEKKRKNPRRPVNKGKDQRKGRERK